MATNRFTLPEGRKHSFIALEGSAREGAVGRSISTVIDYQRRQTWRSRPYRFAGGGVGAETPGHPPAGGTAHLAFKHFSACSSFSMMRSISDGREVRRAF